MEVRRIDEEVTDLMARKVAAYERYQESIKEGEDLDEKHDQVRIALLALAKKSKGTLRLIKLVREKRATFWRRDRDDGNRGEADQGDGGGVGVPGVLGGVPAWSHLQVLRGPPGLQGLHPEDDRVPDVQGGVHVGHLQEVQRRGEAS